MDLQEKPLPTPREESLTVVVREKIERMILSGEVSSGERLNEKTLAAEFGVSRGPIREAARSLEQSGLVKIVQNRGVFVREIGLEEALGLYDLRAGLARVAGRLLAARATDKQIDTLNGIYEDLEEARSRHDQTAYNVGNHLLHAKLMEYSGNARLIAVHEGIDKELRLFIPRGVLGKTRLRLSNQEHRKILDCVFQGDAEGAADAFEQHVIRGKARMLDSLV